MIEQSSKKRNREPQQPILMTDIGCCSDSRSSSDIGAIPTSSAGTGSATSSVKKARIESTLQAHTQLTTSMNKGDLIAIDRDRIVWNQKVFQNMKLSLQRRLAAEKQQRQ